ncbi:MAG: ABC transporter permease, partial [Oscillibacter sp.]|nr:ABC transporter permease [Oscillibacter sp.]
MRKGGFFPRLALSNLMRSRQFYLPYLLTVIGTGAAYYIASALAGARDLPVMTRYAYLAAFMQIGTFVIALFAVIFLTYTNSFLMKRRRRELGLYNILGLGKRHIAVMLGLETLYTAAAGIAGSIALGLLLQKLVTLLLYKIMRFDAYYGFYVSGRSIGATAILLSVILFFNLLLNLGRIHLQNPAELLREGSAGEREPRTNRPAAVLGVLCLGGGYAIAVITKSASTAMGLYFIAVFLVILGTYLLFSAVSIAVLKALRNNKRYYYQTNHFIGVSGMLYRMKRNAAGLANICILSTMVLVMISGTLSLYLNSRDAIARQFPGNMGIGVEYRPSAQSPFDSGALSTQVAAELRREKLSGSPVYGYSWLGLLAAEKNGGYQICSSYSGSSCQLCFLTAEQYAKITGGAPESEFSSELSLAFPGGGKMQLSVRPLSKNLPAIGGAFASTIEPKWFILKDAFDLDALYQAQAAALGSEDAASMSWYGFWNVKGEEQQLTDLPQTLEEGLAFDGTGSFERLEVQTAQAYSR